MSREKTLKRVSFITLLLNILLASSKILIGILFFSPSVFSDGINNLADVGTTLTTFITIKFLKEKEDKDHRYGHERIEMLISYTLAIILLLTGVYLLIQCINDLLNHQVPSFSYVSIIIISISIITKTIMFLINKIYGKKYNFSPMIIDSINNFGDIFSSAAVLLGLVIYKFFDIWYSEYIAVIIISLIIIYQAIKMIIKTKDYLVDKAVKQKLVNEMTEVVLSIEGVMSVDSMMTRLYPNEMMFVDIDISVDGEKSLKEAHFIAHLVHDILENDFRVKHCMVHVNPSESKEENE